MKVNGTPIGDYNFRPAAATVHYTLDYELEQARIYAGISIAEFDAMPGDPIWLDPARGGRSKCHILMLYRMYHAIPAATTDAQTRQMENDMKRRRPRLS